MGHLNLFSAIVLLAASGIPFYFALKVRSRGGYGAVPLLLGLTLVVHAAHHLFEWVEMTIASLVAGTSSALLALAFGMGYYASWRNARGRA